MEFLDKIFRLRLFSLRNGRETQCQASIENCPRINTQASNFDRQQVKAIQDCDRHLLKT